MILPRTGRRAMRPSPRAVALIAALTLLLGACKPSEVKDPNADVTLTGLVVGPDGSPVGGAEVILSYRESTFGFLEPDEYQRTTTDPGGRYLYPLKGRDLNYETGKAARRFRLQSSLPDRKGLPEVEAFFEVNRTRFPLDLRIWDARAEVSAAGVDWQRAGREYGMGGGYGISFESEDGDEGFWTQERGAQPGSIDPRILEDTRGLVRLKAERIIKAEKDEIRMTYRSGPFVYQAPFGAPPSRGKACFVEDGGQRRDLVPCPATDGALYGADPSLKTEFRSPDPRGKKKVVIDMGAATPVGLIVARSCECPVDISEDGRTWSSLGLAKERTTLVSPAVSARFVRIEILPGQSATEISIWPPSE
jgi:hypothetical protein